MDMISTHGPLTQDAARQQALLKDLLLNGFTESRVDVYNGIVMVRGGGMFGGIKVPQIGEFLQTPP